MSTETKEKQRSPPTAARTEPSQTAASMTDVESRLISHTVTKPDNIAPKTNENVSLEPFVEQIHV